MTLLDDEGNTPLDIAYANGISKVIQIISKIAGGNLGPVNYGRGEVQTLISCPNGCGARLVSDYKAVHLEVCSMREITCKECSERLAFLEEEEHLKTSCRRRLVVCTECGETYRLDVETVHKRDKCLHRLLLCSNGCGDRKKEAELLLHMPHCTWRFVPCKLKCGMQNLRLKDSFHHMKHDCSHRRFTCKNHCGNLILAKSEAHHITFICPHRPVQCEWCKEMVYFVNKAAHERDCALRRYACPNKCGEMLTRDDADLEHHLSLNCKYRFVPCPLQCEVARVREVDLFKHVDELCAERLVPCPLLCTHISTTQSMEASSEVLLLPFRMLDLHVKYECIHRMIRCGHCRVQLRVCDEELHAKIDCGGRLVNCRNLNCIKTLPHSEVTK